MTPDPRTAERALDAALQAPKWAVRPAGFKSYYAHEGPGWTADLKVDYDRATNWPTRDACRAARRFLRERGVDIATVRAYATRKGLHLRVWVNGALLDSAILHVQTLLRDDPWRARFNAARVVKGLGGWNVLFTEKWKDGVLVSWETYDLAWTETISRWLGVKSATVAKKRMRSAT